MKITKEQIITSWSFRRILSIILGGIIIYKAAITQEVVSAIFGLALVTMGIINIGCCGNSCTYTPLQKQNDKI